VSALSEWRGLQFARQYLRCLRNCLRSLGRRRPLDGFPRPLIATDRNGSAARVRRFQMQSLGAACMAALHADIDSHHPMSGHSVNLPDASRGHQGQLLVAPDIRCRITCGSNQP
jgi:hypothetical protein